MFSRALAVLFATLLASISVYAETLDVNGVRLDFRSGELSVQGQSVSSPLDAAGRPVYVLPVSEVPDVAVAGNKVILRYLTKAGGEKERGLVVLEYKALPVKYSNLIPLPTTLKWDDNSYVRQLAKGLYFGVFLPKRMQFVYRDGVLAVNDGAWMGLYAR